MSRSVDEWVGKSDDTAIPPRVKDRILERQGNRCAITGIEFCPGTPAEFDHIKPLIMGGENRESNLQAIIKPAHKEKTRADVRAKAKAARVRKKHMGLDTKKPKSKWKRKIDGTVVRRDA